MSPSAAAPRDAQAAPSATPPSSGFHARDTARTTPAALMSQYRRIVMAGDAVAALMAGVLALSIRFGFDAPTPYIVLTLLVPVVWVASVAIQRGYETRFLGTGPDEFRRLGDATLMVFAAAAVSSYVVKGDLSRGYVLIVIPIALILTFLLRRRMRRWLFGQRLRGRGVQRVLVVGREDQVRHVVEQFEREPWHGLQPVAASVTQMVIDLTSDEPGWGVRLPYDGDADSLLAQVDALEVDVVAVASDPDLSGHALRRLAWALEERGVDLIVSPGIVEVAGPRLSIRPVAGLSLLHLDQPAVRGGRMLIKQSVDRLSALGLLLLASPLLAMVALVIKLSSPGPVIFRQVRIGMGGESFEMLKFRTMVVDAEARLADLAASNDGSGPLFKMRNDPRVTRVGAVLRRFSLDELPQLWNVVRGEMSLVGPRPPLPQEVAQYDSDATRRLRVRPGLTGLWQVSGRSDLSWEESMRLDLRYVDNWSFWLDLAIVWRTARAVLERRGAY